jgi:triacylglycerol esterase/lipase EstA (alpha/beta hydrolase family)
MKYLLLGYLSMLLAMLSCKTATVNPTDGIKTVQPPKYPVVLVHGIVAHDRGGIINFWGRIPDILKERGVKVFFGNTDAWGNYESNANILKETIDKILDETKSEKVNIIAHSKGGLDSRYLIWYHNYGDKVASLTTIATPHHGAEIADLIYSQNIVHTNIVKKILETFGRLYGDTNPDMFNVNYQLTTEKMKEFNETVNMDNKVYYQSFYTTIENPLDDIMFFDSYRYIKRIRGDNDGVVSEWSAGWGNNIRKIEGGISHAEIIDYKMQEISGMHIPDIYINIVNELSEMGF